MRSCIRRVFNKWVINKKNLNKQLKQNNIDLCDYTKIEQYIINSALNNLFYLKYLLKKMKIKPYFSCDFIYETSEDKAVFHIEITIDDFKEFLLQKKYNNIIIKKNLEKIIENLSPENQDDEIFTYVSSPKKQDDSILFDKIKYKDLLDLFKSDPTELNIISNKKILGYDISIFFEKILQIDFFNTILRLNLSAEEMDNINKNYSILEFLYQKESFKPFRSVVDEFTLSPKLEQSIMNDIPVDFSNFQKAYFIYKRLCEKFTYDEAYYYLAHKPNGKENSKHSNIEYLSTLEGGEDIICTGISLIYAKFLDKLDIPFQIFDYNDNPVEKLNGTHMKVRFIVDNYIIDADAATFLYKSDLVLEKIGRKVRNFKAINSMIYENEFDFEEELKVVDDYFKKNKHLYEYNDAREAYKNICSSDYSKLTLKERVNLLIDIINSLNMKFFDVMGFILFIKSKIFGEYKNNCQIEFIVNKEDNFKFNMLIGYNENDSYDKNLLENTYIIITPDHKREELHYNELKLRFHNQIYDFTEQDRNIFKLKDGDICETKVVRRP